MAKISCSVSRTTIENDSGREVDGIRATCSRCEHETKSYGTSDASIRRCLLLMRDECPNEESNYYVNEDDE